MYVLKGKKIWIAGHRGMVGSAVARRLASEDCEIITADRNKLDLRRQSDVEAFVAAVRPDVVVMAAAKVGGILANDSFPAEFLYENLVIETNMFAAAHSANVERLLFLGSSCIYPRQAPQPIDESSLLTGALEPTNEWYAIAKIAGVKLAQAYRRQYGRDYISAMPTNLFGPGDNFDLQTSHVMPALMRKAHEAKLQNAESVTIWGTGKPRREFLHCDDCADALVFLLANYSDECVVNVGSGDDLSILELTRLVNEVVGFNGSIVNDLTKPDGTPRKLMSGAKLRSLGWTSRRTLKEGLEDTYRWFLENAEGGRL